MAGANCAGRKLWTASGQEGEEESGLLGLRAYSSSSSTLREMDEELEGIASGMHDASAAWCSLGEELATREGMRWSGNWLADGLGMLLAGAMGRNDNGDWGMQPRERERAKEDSLGRALMDERALRELRTERKVDGWQ